ncbi:MAG: acetyl-CoA acetyltransferase [Rhodospirillaceae bacterium]|nr:acetyl-CoA acetyltransferase [Rhodospirillaceae bacterium]
MTGCIVGWAHTKFGKHEGVELETLVVDAATEALVDAGVAPADVDEIYIGHFNGGFVMQDFPASLVLQAHKDLRFKPATRVENACATGTAAIHQGLNAIAANRAKIVLCVGVEKMTELAGAAIGEVLTKASYYNEEGGDNGSFVDIFARIAESYFQKYGDQSDALAQIAAKNHANGAVNPLAHFQKDLGYEFCREPSDKNPLISGPLKRSDCSPVTDGAAAVVLADTETAKNMDKAVRFRATAHVNDFLPMSRRDVTQFEGAAEAWRQVYDKAKIGVDDLDVVEVHDCFTIAELLIYEAMGLAEKGKGANVIAEGVSAKTGRLPINPSGGLKSKGHPIGATGVSMHVMAAMQARGDAGELQIDGAEIAAVFNMGGSAVANYASVLEAVR